VFNESCLLCVRPCVCVCVGVKAVLCVVVVVVALFISSLLVAVVVYLICLEDLQREGNTEPTVKTAGSYRKIYIQLSSCHCGNFNGVPSNPHQNNCKRTKYFSCFHFPY